MSVPTYCQDGIASKARPAIEAPEAVLGRVFGTRVVQQIVAVDRLSASLI
jgi:hypothetical protein